MTGQPLARRFLLLASAVLVGCDPGGESDAVPHTVFDSAGVEVVVNRAPQLGDGAWTVSSEPVAKIGSVDGPEWALLDRVAGVAQLNDGRIALLNGGTDELRLHAPGGEFLEAIGGSGEGPGEFLAPWHLQMLGDSVQVFDLLLSRLTVIDPGGQVARMETLTWPDARGGVLYLGALSDGSHLGYFGVNLMYTGEISTTGLYRETSTMVRYTPDAASVETVGSFPGMEVFVVVGGDTPRQMTPPFGNRRLNVLHEDRLTMGFTERFELVQYAPDGQLVRVLQKEVEPEPVTAEDRDTYVERYLAEVSSEARRAITFPQTHPAFASLEADELGNLWVEQYRRPVTDGGPSVWSIFDDEGRWLTELRSPEGLDVRFISPECALDHSNHLRRAVPTQDDGMHRGDRPLRHMDGVRRYPDLLGPASPPS